MKTCTKCREVKDYSMFNKCSKYENGKPGLHCYCKPCAKLVSQEWYKNNKEKVKTRTGLYQKNNRNKTRLYGRNFYASHKEKAKGYKLKTKYNITLEQYNELLTKQNNVCAICKLYNVRSHEKNLSVDHCHAAGKVRGLLC